MALLVFEGFDSVNSVADLILGPFNSILGGVNPTIDPTNARTGSGQCIGLNGVASTGMQLLKATGTSSSTIIVGAALITNNGKSFIAVYNGTVCQVSFACDTSGTMTVYRGLPSTGVLLRTAPTIVLASVYNYFELQVTVASGTGGSLTARANGAIVINLAALNTSVDGTSLTNQIGVGSTYTTVGNAGYLDDLYVSDLTGSAPYNTFLGDVHVSTLFPNANASVSWTPSTGANWQNVDDPAMDSDTTYNSSDTPGQTDLFTTPGLSSLPTTIFGVQVKMATRMETAGSDLIAAVVNSHSTIQIGASQPILSSYTYIDQLFLTDPFTTTAWTVAGVNAAQYGYKRII
jgi:hypothetical protein